MQGRVHVGNSGMEPVQQSAADARTAVSLEKDKY